MNGKIDISVIIPAFNEAKRLPSFLGRLIHYCSQSKKIYEIIIVDDGSVDGTSEAILSYKNQFSNLHIIRNRINRGKGYSVKNGILEASGDTCLFIDADGSVAPEEIEKNIHYILEENYDIFVGSRVLRSQEQILKVRWYREIIGSIFNFLTHLFLFKEIEDPQCGFKMFKKGVAKSLFSRSRVRGFGFDIEILYIAHRMGYRIKEGPISWFHVKGCKVNLLTDSIIMFFNIFQVRYWYSTFPSPSGMNL